MKATWEIGDTFVGKGGGTWVWQVVAVADLFEKVRARSLEDGTERIFYFDQMEPAQ